MNEMKNKKLIIVLGTGRSGTSLLMQILREIGVEYADDVIGADASNIVGHFEDSRIVNIQRNFLSSLQKKQGINNPIITEEVLQSDEVTKLREQIEKHIIREIKNNKGNFYALKDPRISVLLPIWQVVFAKNNIEPIYLFALRYPSSVIKSLVTYYHGTKEDAEILWLQRTISSFYYTKSKLFVVHYEKWFESPESQLKDLINYLGYEKKVNISSIIESVIDKKLNIESINNLKKWYEDDFKFIKNCKNLSVNK